MGFGGHPLTAFFYLVGGELFAHLIETLLLFFHLLLNITSIGFGAINDLVSLFLDGLV